ncbi:MAG: hypothetical protein MPW15_06215 [Candidatus Manganitrophus sp.]|nr:hypothetical protein [Candidatus Manganitrophus sp.]
MAGDDIGSHIWIFRFNRISRKVCLLHGFEAHYKPYHCYIIDFIVHKKREKLSWLFGILFLPFRRGNDFAHG